MPVFAELTPNRTLGAPSYPHNEPISAPAGKCPTATPHSRPLSTTTSPGLHPLNLNILTNACVLLEQLQALEHGCAAARARICAKHNLIRDLEKRLRTVRLLNNGHLTDDLDSSGSDFSLETAETSARHTLVLALAQNQAQAQDGNNTDSQIFKESPPSLTSAALQSSPASHRTPMVSPRLRGMFDLYGPGRAASYHSVPGPGVDFKSPSVYSERSAVHRTAAALESEGEEDCYGIWEAATSGLFNLSPLDNDSIRNFPSQSHASQPPPSLNQTCDDSRPTEISSPIHGTRVSSPATQAESTTLIASHLTSRNSATADPPALEPPSKSDTGTTSSKKQQRKVKRERTDSLPFSGSRFFGITHAVSLLHFSISPAPPVSEPSQLASCTPELETATVPSVLTQRSSNRMHPEASMPNALGSSAAPLSTKSKKKPKDGTNIKRRGSQKQKQQKRSAGKASVLKRLLVKRERKGGKQKATPD